MEEARSSTHLTTGNKVIDVMQYLLLAKAVIWYVIWYNIRMKGKAK